MIPEIVKFAHAAESVENAELIEAQKQNPACLLNWRITVVLEDGTEVEEDVCKEGIMMYTNHIRSLIPKSFQ